MRVSLLSFVTARCAVEAGEQAERTYKHLRSNQTSTQVGNPETGQRLRWSCAIYEFLKSQNSGSNLSDRRCLAGWRASAAAFSGAALEDEHFPVAPGRSLRT